MVNSKSNATYYIQIKLGWGKDEVIYLPQIEMGYKQYSEIVSSIENGTYTREDAVGISFCARWTDNSKKNGIDTRILAQRTYPAKQYHKHGTIRKS